MIKLETQINLTTSLLSWKLHHEFGNIDIDLEKNKANVDTSFSFWKLHY